MGSTCGGVRYQRIFDQTSQRDRADAHCWSRRLVWLRDKGCLTGRESTSIAYWTLAYCTSTFDFLDPKLLAVWNFGSGLYCLHVQPLLLLGSFPTFLGGPSQIVSLVLWHPLVFSAGFLADAIGS